MGVGPDGTLPPEMFLDGAPVSIGGGGSGDIASRYDNITDGVLNLVGDEYVFFDCIFLSFMSKEFHVCSKCFVMCVLTNMHTFGFPLHAGSA